MKKIAKRVLPIACVLVICLSLLGGATVAALDWWMKEVTYVLNDKDPVAVTGSYSRIFLPEAIAKLPDGRKMVINYKIAKDGEVVKEGKLESGAYFDMIGAGKYAFTYTGVDATNSYSFEVEGRDDEPSVILEKNLSLVAYTDKAYTVPEGKLRLGNDIVDATVTIEMANGHRYAGTEKIIPESGLMFVVYTAQFGGKQYQVSYEVEVYDTGIGFYDEAGAFYPMGETAPGKPSVRGCILNGGSTVTYTYSEILDLSACTKDTPLLVLDNPTTSGATGDRVLPSFKLVDAHNPNNYIEVVGRWNADHPACVYTVARTPQQTLLGHVKGNPYTDTMFGTDTTFRWKGDYTGGRTATYYYDAGEKALYVDWYGEKKIVSDFDAEYQVYPWEGFTTGEVYLVIEKRSSSSHLSVESVAGMNLTVREKETAGPDLYVNVDKENVPNAGAGYDYSVFDAYAVDIYDSSVPVSIHVYRGYNATSGIELNIADGKFRPYDAGYYTIVYEAQDRFGVKSVQKINVLALSADEVPPIKADIPGIPKTGTVGQKIAVNAPNAISGGSGNVTYVIKHIAPDGTVNLVTDGITLLKQEGTNKIVYEFTDYIGRSESISFDINVEKANAPILYPVSVPEYLRSGKIFVIPELSYYAEDGATVTITAMLNGKALEVTNNTILPVINGVREEMTLTYCVTNPSGAAQKETYTITVLDGDIADRTTFFYTTQGDFQIQQKADRIYFTTTRSNSSVMFLNPVLASKLRLSLYVDPQKNNSDRITIMFTDALDPSISVRLDIVKLPDKPGSSDIYINGVRINTMEGDFYGATSALELRYSAKSHSLTDAIGSAVGTLVRTIDGKPFNGFPSGEVYVTIAAGDVGTNGFAISLLQMNNQTFYDNDLFFDAQAEVSLEGQLDLQREIGDKITIPAAKVGDVFTAECDATVMVRIGGEVLFEDLPADVTHEITLDRYGSYQIIYRYSDGGRTRSVTYTIATIEKNPPQVKVPKLPTTAKVGEVVKLTVPTVSDDYTKNVNVSVIIMAPNSNMIRASAGSPSFRAEMAGKYTVMFYIYDECFNYQLVTHTIEVTN